MSTLEVLGAKLSYKVIGRGPLIVFIPGSRGIGAVYQSIAQHLEANYKVLTFDRRGFGNSLLDGPQDYSIRLHTDAEDVARLIRQVGTGPAVVFGNSSGAIVALQVLIDHPDVVATLIAHEPPALRRLPPAETEMRMAFSDELYRTYRTSGLKAASGPFMMQVMTASDRAVLAEIAARDQAQAARNYDYWFEHELRQYPPTVFDDTKLLAARERLLFIAGAESIDLYPHKIAVLFAEELGVPLMTLPGGHVGFAAFGEAFAQGLSAILDARRQPESR